MACARRITLYGSRFSVCCNIPPAMVTVSKIDLSALARVGKALADGTRRRLLVSLLPGARYPSDLAGELGLTRANVSNHLACLRGCGLVVAVPEGRNVRYELADARLADALRELSLLALPDTDCEPEDLDG